MIGPVLEGALMGGGVMFLVMGTVVLLLYRHMHAQIKAEMVTVERSKSVQQRGWIWKTKYEIVTERFHKGDIPITPYFEHKLQIDQRIDPAELEMTTDAARKLILLAPRVIKGAAKLLA